MLVLEMELVCFTVFSLTNGYTTQFFISWDEIYYADRKKQEFLFADCCIDPHWFGSHSCKYKLRKIGFVLLLHNTYNDIVFGFDFRLLTTELVLYMLGYAHCL